MRVANTCKIAQPLLPVTPAPDPTATTITAVGSIPVDRLVADNLGGDSVTLGRIVNRRVLAYRDDSAQLHQLTWAEFISNYANKWGGAHLDEEIPAMLATADTHSTGRTALASHLLRTIGGQSLERRPGNFLRNHAANLTETERDGWCILAATAPDGRPSSLPRQRALAALTISTESAYIGFHIVDPHIVTPIGRYRLGGIYRSLHFVPDGNSAAINATIQPAGPRIPHFDDRPASFKGMSINLTGRFFSIQSAPAGGPRNVQSVSGRVEIT